MQTIEATISLLVLLTISLSLLQILPEQKIDDSLYRMQLAEDAWRVLYLRGDFRDFSEMNRTDIERDLATIGDETSFCVFIEGVRFTNCRWSADESADGVGEGAEDRTGSGTLGRVASIERTLIEDGKPDQIMLTLTTRHSTNCSILIFLHG